MPDQMEVNALLEKLNPLVFGPQSRLRLKYVRFDEVREQDVNANVMPTGMFNALVANVSKHKALESLPLMATRVETPDVIEVVSGHHRTRAARQAGVEGGVVLLYEGLTDGEIRAKQLAHNSISGTSDPEIVKEIFSQIDDIQAQMESFIDPAAFDNMPEAVKFEMIDIDPLADAKTVTVVFLPTQLRDFGTALELLTSDPDEVYLASREAFDGFKEAVLRTKEELEIVSYPTALAAMARLALERLAQIKEKRASVVAEAIARGEEAPPKEVGSVELDEEMIHALT